MRFLKEVCLSPEGERGGSHKSMNPSYGLKGLEQRIGPVWKIWSRVAVAPVSFGSRSAGSILGDFLYI